MPRYREDLNTTYSAAKGESSIAGLTSIQLLGGESGNYVIAEADNADIMKGSLQVLYNGSYTLTAVDGAGNEKYATQKIEDIFLVAQNGAITVNDAAVAQAQKDLDSAKEARDSITDTESDKYTAAQAAVDEATEHLEAMKSSDISGFIDQNELIDWKSTNYFSGLTRG